MWMIFRHEFFLVTRRPLWKIAIAAMLGLLAASIWTAASRFSTELGERRRLQSLYARELARQSVASAARLQHPVFKPPWRLSFLVDGGQATAPDAYGQQLETEEITGLSRTFSRNDRLPNSPPLDWLLVLRVALSLLAFGLCFDRFCVERDAGTLKLLFSYSTPRWKILAGKLLATWTCLAVPLLAGAAIGFGAIQQDQIWGRQELAKATSVVILLVWALVVFVGLALLASALTREAASSLTVLLLVWVGLVLVSPAVALFAAQRLRPIPVQEQIDGLLAEAAQRIARQYAGTGTRWRGYQAGAQDDFAWERRSGEATSQLFWLQEKIRRHVLSTKIQQAELARDLATISPMFLIQGIAERLAGTGVLRDRRFLEQAWRFREILGDAIKRQDARDPESAHIFFFPDYMSKRHLDISEIPRFVFREATFREGLISALPWIYLLALETVLLFAAAFWAFERYDVGRSGER